MNGRSVALTLWLPVAILIGGLAVFSGGCESAPSAPPDDPGPQPRWLTVVSPHNKDIRSVFGKAFSDHRVAQQLEPVYFNWISRGTPECLEYIESVGVTDTTNHARSAPDIMFGGAVSDHERLAERGQSVSIDVGDALTGIPTEIHGVTTRSATGHWFATGLSSFGILFNRTGCEAWSVAAPTGWSDLADPRFDTWVGLSHPDFSGSTRECLLLILQTRGWDEGWGTVVRILANTRALADRSSVALHQVDTGVSLVGTAVSFDGLALAAGSSGRLEYVNPADGTAVTPNAVSVLAASDDKALATEFVKFCLSDEGQKLWGIRLENADLRADSLFIYPVRPSVYERFRDQFVLTENPLVNPLGIEVDEALRARHARILLPMIRALTPLHVRLQQVWQDVIAAGLPEEALAELTSLPFNQTQANELGERYEAADATDRAALEQEWTEMFRTKLARVAAML